MSADQEKVVQAMQSVVRAHDVLNQFHKEVVAFYGIVDEQLGEEFEAIDAKNLVWVPGYKLKDSDNWLPSWMGRFYFQPANEADDEESSGEEDGIEGVDRFALAFVWILSHDPDVPDFMEPEVWFGVADPGENHRFDTHWDFGRKGLWNHLAAYETPPERWVNHQLPDSSNKFGKGGFYYVKRIPLSNLLDEAHIRELVTEPLRAKHAEVFGPPNQ